MEKFVYALLMYRVGGPLLPRVWIWIGAVILNFFRFRDVSSFVLNFEARIARINFHINGKTLVEMRWKFRLFGSRLVSGEWEFTRLSIRLEFVFIVWRWLKKYTSRPPARLHLRKKFNDKNYNKFCDAEAVTFTFSCEIKFKFNLGGIISSFLPKYRVQLLAHCKEKL